MITIGDIGMKNMTVFLFMVKITSGGTLLPPSLWIIMANCACVIIQLTLVTRVGKLRKLMKMLVKQLNMFLDLAISWKGKILKQ